MPVELLDAAGRRRSPATVPGYRRGCVPRNKGRRFPADPPRVEEIIAVMRAAGTGIHGARMRALVVILWRAGLRINEALTLAETDLEPRRGSIMVRHGKGGKRREVGMDEWAWEHVEPWRQVGASFRSGRCCVSLTVRRAAERGHKPARERSSGDCPRLQVFADDSRRISFATRTLSRWHAKACLCRSSSASSDMHTSASPAPTYKGSTRPRSSTRSTHGARR